METKNMLPSGFSNYRPLLKYHWMPGATVLLTIVSLATLSAYLQKPTYVAEGKLKLKRDNPAASLTELGKSVDKLDPLTETGNPLLTETQVIQSQPVIESALKQLNWTQPNGQPIKPQDFLTQLSITHLKDSDVLNLSFKDQNPQKAADGINAIINAYLQSGVQSNQEEVNTAGQFISARLPKAKQQVQTSENRLREFKQTHQILTLKDQVVSAQVRIDDSQKKIAENEAQIANTSAQEGFVASKLGISSEEAVVISSLSQSPEIQDLLTKIQQVQSQLILARNNLTEDHPTIVSLEGNLADLKGLFAQKATKISGSTPISFNPDSLIGKLRQDLTAELVRLETIRKGQQQESEKLTAKLKSYQKEVATLPQLEQQQNELERQLNAAQLSYNDLLKKLQETQVAANQAQGNVRIISKAMVPDKPSAPRKPLYIATGLILGSILAFLTMYGLEMFNKSLRTVDEIRQRFNLPILGVIPLLGRKRLRFFYDRTAQSATPQRYLVDFPTHKISDAYRLLQSNLKSLGVSKRCKVLTVTSILPQEGKSTVAANLAIALSQDGHSTLLIEADFQDPIQEYIWSQSSEVGLNNVLAAHASWRDAIQQTLPNLHVMLAGNLEHQAIPGMDSIGASNLVGSALPSLDSKPMKTLLAELSHYYDFILLDTTAIKTTADTARLSQLVDGILLVVQPGHIDVDSVTFGQQVLSQISNPVLGLILNQVQSTHEPDTYYYLAPQQGVLPEAIDQSSKYLLPAFMDFEEFQQEGTSFETSWNNRAVEDIPLDQFQATVASLQKDWLNSERFVREQEEELTAQSQTIREIQEKLHTVGEYHRHAASEYEWLSLEIQLIDEEERKRLLNQTLIGQRRRLREKQAILRQHLQILEKRYQSTSSNNNSEMIIYKGSEALEGESESRPLQT
jgi:polysaccharide biosynthesis transport protein